MFEVPVLFIYYFVIVPVQTLCKFFVLVLQHRGARVYLAVGSTTTILLMITMSSALSSVVCQPMAFRSKDAKFNTTSRIQSSCKSILGSQGSAKDCVGVVVLTVVLPQFWLLVLFFLKAGAKVLIYLVAPRNWGHSHKFIRITVQTLDELARLADALGGETDLRLQPIGIAGRYFPAGSVLVASEGDMFGLTTRTGLLSLQDNLRRGKLKFTIARSRCNTFGVELLSWTDARKRLGLNNWEAALAAVFRWMVFYGVKTAILILVYVIGQCSKTSANDNAPCLRYSVLVAELLTFVVSLSSAAFCPSYLLIDLSVYWKLPRRGNGHKDWIECLRPPTLRGQHVLGSLALLVMPKQYVLGALIRNILPQEDATGDPLAELPYRITVDTARFLVFLSQADALLALTALASKFNLDWFLNVYHGEEVLWADSLHIMLLVIYGSEAAAAVLYLFMWFLQASSLICRY